MKVLHLALALAGALTLAPCAALATPPPAIRMTVGVCDPNNPTSCALTPAASTNASTTVTLGNTYQTVFAASTSRKGCLIQNPTTATEVLNVRVGGTAVFTVPAGATFACASSGGLVISDLIEVTAATTSHAFTAVSQ